MSGKAEFSPKSWTEGGTLVAIDATADDHGKLIPKVRIVNPGWNDRKTSGYMYMIIYGIIEEKTKQDRDDIKSSKQQRAFGAFPLGVGKSMADPDDLLKAILQLDITVRRTAGAGEKLVMGVSNVNPLLNPWHLILDNGAIFSALKVCSNIDVVPVDRALRLRPIFLTITLLTDAGVYKIPNNVLDFRLNKAISLNLLVELLIGTDFTTSGVKGMINEDGERVTTFMVHIGNFLRQSGGR